jgi:hypothetical protein
MNFIESIFGISPDSGSGLLEWILLLISFAVIAVHTCTNADARSAVTKAVQR